jgi:hypothetical protein
MEIIRPTIIFSIEPRVLRTHIHLSAQTSLYSNASCAVSLVAGSKFVKYSIRSLNYASMFFHRENGLHGLFSLKPSRIT